MNDFYEYLEGKEGMIELYLSSSDLDRLIRFNNELYNKGYVIGKRLFAILETFQEVLEMLNSIDFEFDSIEIFYHSGYYFVFFDTIVSKAINEMSYENSNKYWLGLHFYVMNSIDFDEILDLAKKYKIDLVQVKSDFSRVIEVNEK
jgi:hypothetical protein